MQDGFEKIAGIVYKRWRASVAKEADSHPDEESLSCFLDGKLSLKESEQIKSHILTCQDCAETVSLGLKMGIEASGQEVSGDMLSRLKELVCGRTLEIAVRLKQKALEVIRTSGDVLIGREFIPAPLLRARKIRDFKDEVAIFKNFGDFRIEVRIESKGAEVFNLVVAVRPEQQQKVSEDLRITLLEAGTELESYLADSGKVSFNDISPGRYTVAVSASGGRVALVVLDVEV